MIKKLNKIKHYLYFGVIILALLGLSVYLFIAAVNAKTVGTEIGNTVGEYVGTAKGSLLAVGDAEEFIHQGENDAVLAKDTKIAEITKTIQITGKLRVLTTEVSLDNLHQVGDKYKALYIMQGTVNFTVDLSKTDITYDETTNTLYVTIPEPVADLKINSETVKKLSESKKFTFVDNAEKGSSAYINSMNELKANVKEVLENYDSLIKIAKDESELRVTELIGSLSFVDNIVIRFEGGEQ